MFVHVSLPMNLIFSRLKLEEEQRAKERIREEEIAAAAAAAAAAATKSSSQENTLQGRPSLAVTPHENSNSNSIHSDRKERERQREKRKSEKEAEHYRKATVNLPSESSSVRGAKVHTVSPLYTSYPVIADQRNEVTEQASAPEPCPSPVVQQEKQTEEFSLGALEAMAALKQRTLTPIPPEVECPKQEEVTIPLDLSETSAVVRTEIPQNHTETVNLVETALKVEDPVRSLLDVRVERWKRKRQKSDPGEEEVDDDLDEEMCPDSSESVVSMSVEQCLKSYPVPAGVSEEQHHFLHMFGLVTPQKRSGITIDLCSISRVLPITVFF